MKSATGRKVSSYFQHRIHACVCIDTIMHDSNVAGTHCEAVAAARTATTQLHVSKLYQVIVRLKEMCV